MTQQTSKGVTRRTTPPGRGDAAAHLTLRVDFGAQGALGPGKVRLLELIAEQGSITAAGKAMGMSYRRAWLLVDGLNQAFASPLVETQHGGPGGGGAALSPLGQSIIRHYRAMEAAATAATASHLTALTDALAERSA
ncbi:MAG: LysR family transcriptional regulator [Alphaproteobacteria bacterium]|nr:LysR family transcriptional regulator [Alphaproteobacteria bacterium]MBU0797419.1 LysR family transcriptional regulator [Alphaproteobacteria bacterium]MBU0888538.1 LysR family transcriptional regulator [Alphaproteobacteria bacterium]MBU1813728.1 LysR family transcriptional regulator [Alphaproteobacteria bacterium]MBU2091164.1 LysR family transcriptional regulator [Alphaproteobacteria bacterium]